jgi:hypothetical protein
LHVWTKAYKSANLKEIAFHLFFLEMFILHFSPPSL